MTNFVKSCYISAACNCTPTCVDWGENNLICYGSCHAVFIYSLDEGGGKIIKVLTGHTNRVNSVRWIRKSTALELVSGGADGQVIVWSLNNDLYKPAVLEGHTDTVNIVDALYINDLTIVLSASMDSTVKLWIRKCDNFQLSQSIELGYGICLALKCIFLPEPNSLLCALALDNCSIELHSLDNFNDLYFHCVGVLKGHEDWVRGLDFKIENTGDLLLASSSQDCFVRLWRFSSKDKTNNNQSIMVFNDIETNQKIYTVSLTAILTGHEGWVYSVNWHPNSEKLLTASIDKTMILWEMDPTTNLWLENIRVGEVGGNTLGFYGGMFGPSGESILAYSYHGAFHIWHHDSKSISWQPAVTVGGHFGEVVDLSWEPNGEFVISVSTDQTTRIHAPWRKSSFSTIAWHEIARPQVHGYDMSSLAVLSRYRFVSSAEEKVIRAFQAPVNFRENFIRICNITEVDHADLQTNAKGASVPSLGLSNKAVYENDNKEQSRIKGKEMYAEESHFTATELTVPPTEETLIQNTLWPEVQKLYGHGYEVYCLATNSNGSLVASACKSTNLEHASILLWETTTWRCIQKLQSHTLTVVQLAFSPNSKNLLSVSRDRRWSIFTLKPETNFFELAATTNKSNGIHSRIIWCCAFSHDSKYFATGSRDGKLVLWHKNNEIDPKPLIGQYEAAPNFLELKGESITAVAFAPELINKEYFLAIGLESGLIQLYKWYNDWSLITVLDKSAAHHLTVKRICFRPKLGIAGDKDGQKDILQIASCSADHSVKIHNIHYTEFVS